jgi:thymidylate synthase ThyX
MVSDERLAKMGEHPDIKVLACLKGVDDVRIGVDSLPVYAARGCFEEKTPLDLFLEDMSRLALPAEEDGLTPEKFERRLEGTFRETSGRGHGAVLDQSFFVFQAEDIPRIATLQLCLPQYLMHLQQSLRRAKADRGFYLPGSIRQSSLIGKAVAALDSAFVFYGEMQAAEVPGEDARFILPLYTKTNIVTSGNARELMHLHNMSRKGHMPSVVRETVDDMISKVMALAPHLMAERANNYEPLAWLPSSQLFAPANRTIADLVQGKNVPASTLMLDYSGIPVSEAAIERAVRGRDEAELANLKHIHFTFLAPMSLACFHQATRQRTWDQGVESIYDAAARGDFVVPPSIAKRDDLKGRYDEMTMRLMALYNELVSSGIPKQDAIGVVSHALLVYDMIHVNGWNAIHSIGKRTCTEAQWEIRGIAKEMARNIDRENPALGKYAKPQGVTYGRCPERKPCGACTGKTAEGK